jgi:hypothetical protein
MRRLIVLVGMPFVLIACGDVAGNVAMWTVSYATTGVAPPVRHQPVDMIAAAFASMLGAGLTGYAIGRSRQKSGSAP